MRLMGCIMLLFVAMVHIGCETPQGGGSSVAPTAATGSTDAGGTLTDADLKRMGIVEMSNNR
ncbi:MAG: hypothetical protein IIA62_02135 [Nitrospinae bacterium]|nr:hypothetical protein [Nitrospinota bacterium]